MIKQVQKREGIFLVTDECGNIPWDNTRGLGLYDRDTRFLSVLDCRINGLSPTLLASSSEENVVGSLQLANPALPLADGTLVAPLTVSIWRSRYIDDGLRERIGLVNYNRFPLPVELQLIFGADFQDIFDIRGYVREKRGSVAPPTWEGCVLRLSYAGLDGLTRATEITFDPSPAEVHCEREQSETTAYTWSLLPNFALPDLRTVERPPCAAVIFRLMLEPQRPCSIAVRATPVLAQGSDPPRSFDEGVDGLFRASARWREESTTIETDNPSFNRMCERGHLDLRALTEHTPDGLFPVAGVPWFSAPFGRDSIITALEMLMLRPEVARGTLRFLARHQGRQVDPWRDEEPGKIMHEMRQGEMARLGVIPHTPYFGSVDATPLFLVLFAQTMDWLDDEALYEEVLPAARAALTWIDRYGDLDGDGYVEYRPRSARGILHQGWKDSNNSLQRADGSVVLPPTALVEVQGYVYDAKVRMARLLARKGQRQEAARLEAEAGALRAQFNRDYWLPAQSFLAQALDSEKVPVDAVTSNAGHCLWSGIVEPGTAAAVAARLLSPDLFSGWGVRTLSSASPNFNPMSYHNGSVWPHDNALVAAGLRRYGFADAALRVIDGIVEAGLRFRYLRLPELFCGFGRDQRYQAMPAEYPVSCSPQAWAAGSVFLFLQTLLGLEPDAPGGRVTLRPLLPSWLQWIRLRGLRVGGSRMDLTVRREGEEVRVEVLRAPDGLEVAVGEG